MKLTVVVDHMSSKNTMLAESGFSVLIEHADKRILFDTGATEIVVRNLNALGVSVSSIDALILSHGHFDHTWGGGSLIVHGLQCPVYASAHINAGHALKQNSHLMPCGCFNPLLQNGFCAIETPQEIIPDIWALPTNQRDPDYIPSTPLLTDACGNLDSFPDDLSLVLKTVSGLVLLTGCAHGGLVNVLESAALHFKTRKFDTVIGGFHMAGQRKDYIERVQQHLKENFEIRRWRPCHCTGFPAAAAFFNISEDVDWPGAGYSISL